MFRRLTVQIELHPEADASISFGKAMAPYSIESAWTDAKLHLQQGNFQMAAELIYLRFVLASDQLAAQRQIRLQTHRSRTAFLRFIAEAESNVFVSNEVKSCYTQTEELHTLFYRYKTPDAVDQFAQFVSNADRLVQYLLTLDLNEFSMEHFHGYAKGLHSVARQPDPKEQNWWLFY